MAVVLADIEAGPLTRITAELEDKGAKVYGVPTDVTDAESMDRLGSSPRTWCVKRPPLDPVFAG